MNLSHFISKRIIASRQESFSSTIHKIAVASIAVGVAACIVAFLILVGFQQTVMQKVFSFSGHLVVTKLTMNNSFEESPMDYNIPIYRDYKSYGFIDHVQEFGHKAGLIKSGDEILGVLIKGVGKSFDLDRFSDNLVEGRFINLPDSGYSNEVVVSRIIASKLKLSVDDDVIIHFFQDPPRVRRLKVSGIYETNLSEFFDDRVIIGDIRMIARITGWADSVASGLEIFVKDVNRVEQDAEILANDIDYDLSVQSVSRKYIQVFDWLHLLSRQVNILLGIILTVVCVNMISVVLILVMERTPMIGVLKAMGARNRLISMIFMNSGYRLILRGLWWGNLIGLGICLLQDEFKIIKLNAHDYYMSYVPVGWAWSLVVGVNVLTLIVVTVALTVPTAVITRIRPVNAIRFD